MGIANAVTGQVTTPAVRTIEQRMAAVMQELDISADGHSEFANDIREIIKELQRLQQKAKGG